MLIRKFNDGYYLCTAKRGSANHKLNRELKRIWFVRYSIYSHGEVGIGHNSVSTPKELIGKKIMFKVEIDELRGVEV